tara:strand:+ start:7696 stop:10071 length:2376 start_codon:yes stop_codon:yes gene_type:complete
LAEIIPLKPELDNTSGGNSPMKVTIYLFLFFLHSLTIAKITGVVIDSLNNLPISDVNIIADDGGASTDRLGRFSITTKSKFFNISHIGYYDKTVLVKDSMIVFLNSQVTQINNVLVLSDLNDGYLLDNASSISIISNQKIKNSDQVHFQNLIDYIPNLNWAGGTSRPRYFQIRGIGERSQYFGEGSPNFSVSYTIDDIDLSGVGMIGGLNDLKQIEVFKGSQSTVFGNNAIGGSISLKSNEPTSHNHFKVISKIGTDSFNLYSFLANVKLMDNVYLRFNIDKNNQGGFRENVFLDKDDTNKKDEMFFRLKLKIKPSKKLSINNTVMISEMNNGYDAWAPDNNDNYITYSDQPGEDSHTLQAFSTKLEYDNIHWNLLGVFSRSSSNIIHSYDSDWGNNSFWNDSSTYGFDPYYYGYYSPYQFFDQTIRNRETLTGEFRINVKDNIFGIYIKKLNENDKAEGYLFGGDAVQGISDYDIDVKAVYAQTSFRLSNRLSNTNSIRYERNKIFYDGSSYSYYGDTLPLVSLDKIYDLIGFKSAFKYNINSYARIYGHISKGYKSGGVNQQPYVSKINRDYNPEYLMNYELGYRKKSETSLLNISFFVSDRIDQQVSVSAQQYDNDPNSFYYFTANSGKGWLRGLELEYDFNLMKYVDINYSFGFLETWTDKFSFEVAEGIEQVSGNREAAMSPNISSSITISYRHAGYFITYNQTYKGAYYYSDSHNNQTEPYSLSNVSLGRQIKKFTVSLWGNNIFDKRYPVRGFYFGLIPPNYDPQLWLSYGDPFQAGFTISYDF